MDRSGDNVFDDLAFLYGEEQAREARDRLEKMLDRFQKKHPGLAPLPAGGRVSESDSVLITYGDMVRAEGEASLHTLANFLGRHLAGIVSAVHILPFFPYSSDDGFSVIDYRSVDPDLGAWQNVAEIGDQFNLMFDAVINHISAESAWFKAFLRNDPAYRDYFTVVEQETDLSQVFRPRALPLLTPVRQAATGGGQVEKLVWTTFSADQIDLNFRNADLLLEILDILLFYIGRGARFIRLDAIAYIWKELGTSSIHRPQTHRIIQLMRKVLDRVAPGVAIITETNVPHKDNISYFGDGKNEAQMVYNFSLPPLTLHAFQTGNAEALSRWADSLSLPSEQVTFFNFLASHDGIGVTPARGFLSEAEIGEMAGRVEMLGGQVSQRNNPDGSTSPYELNINYLDALGDPEVSEEDTTLVARRFLASQAIMLALRGVPGIYFHSLFGSQGWPAGVIQTGRARTINREKLQRHHLESELAKTGSLRHQVFHGYRHLLNRRRRCPAFHPNGPQRALFIHPAVFALLRSSPDGQIQALCLHNVSGESHQFTLALSSLPLSQDAILVDLLKDQTYEARRGQLRVSLEPHQVLWLVNG